MDDAGDVAPVVATSVVAVFDVSDPPVPPQATLQTASEVATHPHPDRVTRVTFRAARIRFRRRASVRHAGPNVGRLPKNAKVWSRPPAAWNSATMHGSWKVTVVAVLLACASEDGVQADTDANSESGEQAAQSGAEASGTQPQDEPPETSGGATEGSDPTTSGPAGETGNGDGDEDEDEVGSAGCGAEGLSAGAHAGLTVGDGRTFDLLVPASYDPNVPTTLVINFHGLLSNANQQAWFSQMNEHAEAAGIIVAYPQGVGSSWNAGSCCGSAANQEVDDVAFVRELVEHLSTVLCVSPKRVFATGMSNGGFMSHRLACEASDVFAAIAPVAGVLGVDTATCGARAVPVMHFHGTADLLVPYEGGGVTGSPSVDETIDFWVGHNACATGPEVTFQQGDTTCETWTDCTDGANVTRCRVEMGGHCWPGNAICLSGASTAEIHASAAALDFFAAHPMP